MKVDEKIRNVGVARLRYILCLCLIFGLLFLFHCAANIFMAEKHPDFFLHDDGREYLNGAVSFAESGRVMTGPGRYYEASRTHDIPEIYRSPLLAVFAGTLTVVFRDPLIAAALLQALVAALLAWLCFRIAARLSDSTAAGWIAVLLVTFHPLILTFSLRFSSELLFMLFLALFLYGWLEGKGMWKFAVMGAAAGLASCIRPTALLLLPAFGVYWIVRYAAKGLFPDDLLPKNRFILTGFAVYGAVFLLVISPFCIRNYIHYRTGSPAGCLGGFNFYLGNNRDNAAAYRAPDGKTFLFHQEKAWARALAFAKAMPKDLPPPEQDQRFRRAAFDEIRAMGPAAFCRLTAAKAWHFIRPWPLRGAHPQSVFLIICISEFLLFAAGFAGVFLLRRDRKLLLFLLMILFVGWTAHSLVHLQMRHRVPFLDLLLIPVASVALAGYFNRLFRRRGCEAVSGSSGTPAASSDIGK